MHAVKVEPANLKVEPAKVDAAEMKPTHIQHSNDQDSTFNQKGV